MSWTRLNSKMRKRRFTPEKKNTPVSMFLEIRPMGTAGDRTKPLVFVLDCPRPKADLSLSSVVTWMSTLNASGRMSLLPKSKKHGRKSRYKYQSPILGCLKVLMVLEFIPWPRGWLAVVALEEWQETIPAQEDKVNSRVWACCFPHGFQNTPTFYLAQGHCSQRPWQPFLREC